MKNNLNFIILLTFLIHNTALAEQAPSFDNGILSIPRVDTTGQVGRYQNAQFKLAPDGRWDLHHVRESQPAFVDSIEIQLLESFPVQVHIRISGYLPTPCYQLEPVNIRFIENRFEIAVHVLPLQTLDACVQVLEPFQMTIPLDAYGLSAGHYDVQVNDQTDNFELSIDNQ